MSHVRASVERGLRVFATLLLGGASGCSTNGAARDGGGGRDTGAELHDAGTDSRDAADRRHDGGSDAPVVPDGGACLATSPVASPVASTRCAATAATIDPASLCSGAASCPVTAYDRLTASGESDYPTIAPVGTDGASVMLQFMSPGGLFSCLYTMSAGAPPHAQEFAALTPMPLVTSVGGARSIIAYDGQLGILQETGSGWDLGVVADVSQSSYYLATLGRPNGDLFVSYLDTQGHNGGLVHLHDGCAGAATLPGPTTLFYGIDVDPTGGAWVAGTYTDPNTFVTSIELVGPDGTAFQPTPTVQGIETPQQPIVLAGDVAGAVHFPTLVTYDYYGVHLIEATGSSPVWSDRVIPGSPVANFTGACPPEQQQTPAGGCGSIPTTCSLGLDGPVGGYGAARTASGKTFVAWAEVKGGLSNLAVTCTSAAQGALCECSTTGISSQGSGALVITRVDTATPREVLRLSYPTNIEIAGYQLAMTARGDTLLLAANQGLPTGGGASDLLYFEIDTTGL